MQAERLTISKDLKTGYSECWLIRRNQRFIRFTIGNDLKLYVYAPKNASIEEIETALNKEAAGIPLLLKRKKVSLLEDIKKLQAIMKLENELGDDISYFEYLPKEEFEKRTEEFLPIITAKVEHYAPIVGVNYNQIIIDNNPQRYWGACSSTGDLRFIIALRKVPDKLLDYIVVHELCHRLEFNHSKAFWAQVSRVIPDYKVREWQSQAYTYLFRHTEHLRNAMEKRVSEFYNSVKKK